MTAQPPGFTYPITIYRSEVIRDKDSLEWKPFILNISDVRGLDTEFTISVYDWDDNGGNL